MNQTKGKPVPKPATKSPSPTRGRNVPEVTTSKSFTRSSSKPKMETSHSTKSFNSMQLMYLDKEKLTEGLQHTTQLMQQHREEGNARQIRHEQRRRKFIRQLDTSLISQTKKFFEQEVIGQLLNVSQGESEEIEFRGEVFNFKDIMVMNRRNRDKCIMDLNAAAEERQIAWEAVEAKREIGWVVKLDTKSQLKRRDALQISSRAANRCEATQIVTEFLDKMLDVVDWTITCREVGGFSYRFSNPDKRQKQEEDATSSLLPELIWNDLRRLSSSPLRFASPLPYLVQILPSTLMMPFNISQRPHLADSNWILTNKFNGSYVFDKPKPVDGEGNENAEDYPQLADYLARQDWSDFITALNTFNESQQKTIEFEPVEYPNFTRDALLTPSWVYQTDPQYVFGESIVQIRTVVNPIPEQPEPNLDTSHIILKLALFGTSDYAKQVFVNKITSFIPRIKIISLESLIQNILTSSSPDYTTYSSIEEIESLTPYQLLIRDIQLALKNGESIRDEQYSQLLIAEMQGMTTPNNGFIITDFPNSKEQLVSFMKEVSNIRYDFHRQQPKDYLSFYAPLKESEDWIFDISKCGLDLVICTDHLTGPTSDSIEIPLKERIRARKNLYSQEIIYLNDEVKSVRGLQYLYDPARPYATTGLSLTKLERDIKALTEFCLKLKILQTVKYENFENLADALQATVNEVAEAFLPAEQLTTEFWERIDQEKAQKLMEEAAARQKALEEELYRQQNPIPPEEEVPVAAANEEQQPAEGQQPSVEGEVPAPTANEGGEGAANGENQPRAAESAVVVVEKRLPIIETNSIPLKLAKILDNYWNSIEQQNAENGKQFHSILRDIRFQMLQRRRICMDTIYIAMLRYDSRQELFNSFREQFNLIDNNFRYDPDCIAELFLRTIQLRNEISKLCELRYQDVKGIIEKTEKDQNIFILLYHLKCEGIFLLQNELNRFYGFLNLLFDFTKSIQTYEISERILNELEILLPTTIYDPSKPIDPKAAKDGKDAKKNPKDKNAGVSFIPYREAFPPFMISLNNSLTSNIPLPKEEEIIDPKAKGGKPKDNKKGGEDTGAEPLNEVFKLISDEISKWKEGNFTVSRELYLNRDEKLCKAIEKCVWFEANKLELSCQTIQKSILENIAWIEDVEKQTFTILQEIAYDRFLLELASGEELIQIIEQCIQQARPLSELWLVTPDAMPVVDPLTIWDRLEGFLPDEEIDRFYAFAKPDRLSIERSQDSLDVAIIAAGNLGGVGSHHGHGSHQHHHPSINHHLHQSRPRTSPAHFNSRDGGVSTGDQQQRTYYDDNSSTINAAGPGYYSSHQHPNRTVSADESLYSAMEEPLPKEYPSNANVPRMRPLYPLTMRTNSTVAIGATSNNSNNAFGAGGYQQLSPLPKLGSSFAMETSPSGRMLTRGISIRTKAKSPKMRKDDEITNYNYLKKLIPPNLSQLQKEQYKEKQKHQHGGGGGGGGGAGTGHNEQHDEHGHHHGSAQNGRAGSAGKHGHEKDHDHHANNNHNHKDEHNSHGSSSSSHGKNDSHGPRTHSAGHHHSSHGSSKNNHHGDGHSSHGDHPHSAHGNHRRPSHSGHNGNSRGHASSHGNSRPMTPADPKELEKFYAERQQLEEKLMIRRELREKEFVSMGMSIPNAKLAAYNDLLIDEQNAWSDFENHYKKLHHHSHTPHTPHSGQH